MNWPAVLAGFITTILWPGRAGGRGCINLIPLPESATFDGAVLSTKFSGTPVPGPGNALTTWLEPSKSTKRKKNQQKLAMYTAWGKNSTTKILFKIFVKNYLL